MLDEALLDDPEALARADARGLLRALASAGARVRHAARLADEAGLAQLKPDGHPRAVLVAGDSAAAGQVGELLAALSGGFCPVLPVRPSATMGGGSRGGSRDRSDGGPRGGSHWALPGWAGPLDLLLLASSAGNDPGLPSLVEQAYQRGCTVVAVAPPDSPLTEATQQARGLGLPYAPAAPEDLRSGAAVPGAPGSPGADQAPEDVGALWALFVPLLVLADRIGVATAPASAVQGAADRLDEMAAACGPATATYQNPAKTLAAELAESLPLLWSEGPGPDAVARRFAACLADRAGRPALPAALPEALAAHRGLLAGAFSNGDDTDEFFRDRLEEPRALRLRVVLLREHGHETAVSDATPAHRLAHEHGTAVSEVNASATGPLEDAAQLLALTDFTSAYLSLAER